MYTRRYKSVGARTSCLLYTGIYVRGTSTYRVYNKNIKPVSGAWRTLEIKPPGRLAKEDILSPKSQQ